MLLLNCDGGA